MRAQGGGAGTAGGGPRGAVSAYGISAALVISAGAVEKHVASIFAKLGLPVSEADNRRVLAVLRYVGA